MPDYQQAERNLNTQSTEPAITHWKILTRNQKSNFGTQNCEKKRKSKKCNVNAI